MLLVLQIKIGGKDETGLFKMDPEPTTDDKATDENGTCCDFPISCQKQVDFRSFPRFIHLNVEIAQDTR